MSARRGLIHLAVAFAVTLLAIFESYQLQPSLTVDVGSIGDIPFVSGFHADEADIDYRYRWTTGHSEVRFPDAGSAPVGSVIVSASGAHPVDAAHPVTMSVSVNGQFPAQGEKSWQQVIGPGASLGSDQFFPSAGAQLKGPDYTIGINTSTFLPRGDDRTLGVKVDRVDLIQDFDVENVNWPPLSVVLWALTAVAGLFGLFSFLPWRFPVLPYVGTALIAVLFLYNRLYAALLIPMLGLPLGLLGLLVWQRERVRRWPEWVDALRGGRWAAVIMVGAMLVYALVALWTIPQVDGIGHADYAENAVIARNLVSGKGLTVDYLAQFYRDPGQGLSHPADTWPLLQPLLIAPFLALFGSQTWAAKLPNLFVLLGLTWAVFFVARRLWDARVGLLAGLLTLVHPYFFNAVLYPINDLAFTLIFFVLAWLVWLEVMPAPETKSTLPWMVSASGSPRRRLLAIGALAGLLIWSKPSGAVLLVGLCAFWILDFGFRRSKSDPKSKIQNPKSFLRPLLWVGGAFAVVLLPLVVRNLFAFGVPFFSTEGYDAWILRYWPYHEWEDIYKVYFGQELPHPRWVVGGKFGYENLVNAVARGFESVWKEGVLNPSSGEFVVGLMPLAGALVGLAAAGRWVRGLFGMVGFSLGIYALFVLFYWHFEGRYFQVAVPWVYMLLAWGVLWIFDQIRAGAERDKGQGTRDKGFHWSLLFLPIAVVALLWPSVSAIKNQIDSDITPTGFVTGMEWLRENSGPDDVVMTRDPWELNWHTGRKAVMIPNDNLETIEQIARKYGVTMLQLGGPVDGIDVRRCPDTVGSRPALDDLYCGQERPGFQLVYRQGGLTIYRVTGVGTQEMGLGVGNEYRLLIPESRLLYFYSPRPL